MLKLVLVHQPGRICNVFLVCYADLLNSITTPQQLLKWLKYLIVEHDTVNARYLNSRQLSRWFILG